MNQSPFLYQLQQLDDEIAHTETRLKKIEAEIASDIEITQANAALAEAKNFEHMASHAFSEAEHTVKEIRIKIATSEQSLYGGKIHNPKELQDLQSEIASLKKRLSTAEDNELEQMIKQEEATALLTQAEKDLHEVKDKKASEMALLFGEQDTLAKKVDRLVKERLARLGSISTESLQVYETLRRAKNGKAVALIEDNACEVCGASIRPAEKQAARSSSQLIFCDTCGRILYSG